MQFQSTADLHEFLVVGPGQGSEDEKVWQITWRSTGSCQKFSRLMVLSEAMETMRSIHLPRQRMILGQPWLKDPNRFI